MGNIQTFARVVLDLRSRERLTSRAATGIYIKRLSSDEAGIVGVIGASAGFVSIWAKIRKCSVSCRCGSLHPHSKWARVVALNFRIEAARMPSFKLKLDL